MLKTSIIPTPAIAAGVRAYLLVFCGESKHQIDILVQNGLDDLDTTARVRTVLSAAKYGEAIAALDDLLVIAQASIVNAKTRNENPAIIANLEMKELNARKLLQEMGGKK